VVVAIADAGLRQAIVCLGRFLTDYWSPQGMQNVALELELELFGNN